MLYYVADSQLSGKLETAIQALDNVTKVCDSYANGRPLNTVNFDVVAAAAGWGPGGRSGPAATVTTARTPSPRRFEEQLIPYSLITADHETLKRIHTGLLENIAGLIEIILGMKVSDF